MIDYSYISGSDKIIVDIETLGVRAENAKIWSISLTEPESKNTVVAKWDKINKDNLLKFFKDRTLIFHNALFDLKILLTNMFMKDISDLVGMREGIIWFKENIKIEDTMLMVYHCDNNTQGNELSLKFNTLHWTGNYALDIADINKLLEKVSEKEILEYNATDTLATAMLYEKYSKKLKEEGVEQVYEKNISSVYYLIELMIVGLPIDPERLDEVKDYLNNELDKIMEVLNKYIDNPNSSVQLVKLLYKDFNLPILEYTEAKQPATGKDVLKDLMNHTEDAEILKVLETLINYKDIDKILTSFVNPFYDYMFTRGKTYWMTANHKAGGTVSNRLSSNSPNFAQLPSNSKYGKLIKSMFIAPNNWLFVGSDFEALEDKVIANLSGDKMKQDIFLKGIDGHCLNTAGYFKEELEERGIFIDLNNPDSINSIKKLAKDLRQASKPYTFGISYGQQAPGMAKKQGIPLKKAQKIVDGYNTTFSTLVKWNEENKKQMQKKGYVRGCWGHKVKTPLIHMSLINSAITPSVVKSEFRSANNAITQSYGFLTTIAGSRLQDRIEKSPYKYQIFLMNQIHDAIYLVCKNQPEVIKWVNDNLIEVMCIMDEPIMKISPVKLTAEVDFGKSWDKQITFKNNLSIDEIIEKLKEIE